VESRYAKISDSGRSAKPNRNYRSCRPPICNLKKYGWLEKNG